MAFTLGGAALAFALLGGVTGDFNMRFLDFLPSRLYGLMVRDVLVAVPAGLVAVTIARM